MGNSTSKVLNDVGSFLGTALAAPFKSLLNRSCQDVCVGIWDVVCFIEHICIADLVKFLLVCCLCYICLIFLYLLYKVGICQCVAKTSCKMCWAACETVWLGLDYLCCFCWRKISHTKRVYRGRRQHLRHGHQHHHLHRQQASGDDLEMGYTSTASASASSLVDNNNNNGVVYSDSNVEPSIVGRKRKLRRKKRRRRVENGRSLRLDKRQVSVHHLRNSRSMKERRKKNHLNLKQSQMLDLRQSQRSNTMKFKRQRTR